MPGRIGPLELLIILLVILLLFGANRLPELARAIGKSVTELREGIKGTPEQPPAPAEEDKGKV